MSKRVLVAGATSQIAPYLWNPLTAAGYGVTAVGRRAPRKLPTDVHWLRANIANERLEGVASVKAIVSLAPLGIIVESLAKERLPEVKRIVAFSSTSILTKRGTDDGCEKQAVDKLIQAEAAFERTCTERSIEWTLFRPTMIYDAQNDKNVALIAGFIRRFGFFPLIGQASGKRQPVHAADLARACQRILENPATFGRTYNLGGGEVLRYRDMVDRIFELLGKKPRYVRMPPSLLRVGLRLMRHLPRYGYLNPAMAERMNKDMYFDLSEAMADFDYQPRRFWPATEA